MDFSISLARTAPIYSVDAVRKAATKLGDDAPKGLPRLYQKMVEVGGDRFVVKPSRVPDYQHMKQDLPNFGPVLDEVFKQVALCVDTTDMLEIMPILLVGPPGIGKTRFAKRLSKILCTGYQFVSMNNLTAGWILSGSAATWSGAKPGRVFETLVNGEFANPIVLLDEIDKATGSNQYDPMGPFYTLLERDTAKEFIDEYAEVPIDAGRVIWVATANDPRAIPDAIMQRFMVFDVPAPTADETRVIVASIYREDITSHEWGKNYPEAPSDAVLDILVGVPPREITQVLKSAFGSAKLAGREALRPDDFSVKQDKKRRIGF